MPSAEGAGVESKYTVLYFNCKGLAAYPMQTMGSS